MDQGDLCVPLADPCAQVALAVGCSLRSVPLPSHCPPPSNTSSTCLADCLPRAVSRLTSLRELLVTRDDSGLSTHGEFCIPEQIAELRHLTRLELVR